MHIVIDDVIYFDAQVGTGAINTHALYAYNTSNGTIWLAADLSEPGYHMKPHSMASAIQWREPVVIGDTMYFDARASPYTARTSIGSTCATHTEIYAYNIGNQTAWCVADAEDLDGVVRATTAMPLTTCCIWLATFSCLTQKRVQPRGRSNTNTQFVGTQPVQRLNLGNQYRTHAI